jgi:Fe-S cluster assembly scaffold protein SufB
MDSICYLRVPKNAQLQTPIQIIHYITSTRAGSALFPRLIVHAEAGSSLALKHSYIGDVNAIDSDASDTSPLLICSHSTFKVEEGASIEHTYFQDLQGWFIVMIC